MYCNNIFTTPIEMLHYFNNVETRVVLSYPTGSGLSQAIKHELKTYVYTVLEIQLVVTDKYTLPVLKEYMEKGNTTTHT